MYNNQKPLGNFKEIESYEVLHILEYRGYAKTAKWKKKTKQITHTVTRKWTERETETQKDSEQISNITYLKNSSEGLVLLQSAA